MQANAIPLPPLSLREMVGSPLVENFDNPTGKMLYPDLPAAAYESVFDFGCGCGRHARLLMQQKEHRPRRYMGIDVHWGLIDWCLQNLAPAMAGFEFRHHDVWSPGYGAGNSPRLAEPFPVEDGAFTLFIANSVFTHIYKEQAEYYLFELARILRPDGVAMTSWFFFDNDSFPFLVGGVQTLFVNEIDPTTAVIYDRHWFLDAIRRAGLAVRTTKHPPIAGHQWYLYLEKRRPDSVDSFPLGDDGAEWLCGAGRKAMAAHELTSAQVEDHKVPDHTRTAVTHTGAPPPPPLTGLAADLAAAQAELARLKSHSQGWIFAERMLRAIKTRLRPER